MVDAGDDRLESWKEIAAYLKRDVRTVQRWEKREGLPVYRDAGGSLATVYANRSEISAWLNSRYQRVEAEPESIPVSRRAPRWALAVAVFVVGIVAFAVWRLASPFQKTAAAAGRQLRASTSSFLYDGSVSPDGRHLALRDTRTGNLVLRDLASGASRPLTSYRSWADGSVDATVFSPDGKQVACSLRVKEGMAVRLFGTQGSASRLIHTYGDTLVRVRNWSRDGRSILATSVYPATGEVQLVLISADDGSLRVLKSIGRQYAVATAFSPDGRYVAYDIPPADDVVERDIYLVPVDGGASAPLVEHPADDYFLGWAPDGRHILFASDRTGVVGVWTLPVSQGRPQGSPRLARAEMGRIGPLGITREGTFHYLVQTGGEDVYVADLDPLTGRPVAPPTPLQSRYAGANSAPAWSPDGRSLAFIWQLPQEWRRRSASLVIRTVETGAERRLSPHFNFIYSSIHWSADGGSFYVPAVDRSQNMLFHVDLRTGGVAPVVRSGGYLRQVIGQGIPAQDKRHILYLVNDAEIAGTRIVQRNLKTGIEKVLYRGASVTRMALSPDGRRLALCDAGALSVMPADGGPLRQLTAMPVRDVTWSADGRRLLFAKRLDPAGEERRTELWRIPAEGGTPESLGITMGAVPHMRLHPSGRRIAFAAGTSMAEVWTLEKLLP